MQLTATDPSPPSKTKQSKFVSNWLITITRYLSIADIKIRWWRGTCARGSTRSSSFRKSCFRRGILSLIFRWALSKYNLMSRRKSTMEAVCKSCSSLTSKTASKCQITQWRFWGKLRKISNPPFIWRPSRELLNCTLRPRRRGPCGLRPSNSFLSAAKWIFPKYCWTCKICNRIVGVRTSPRKLKKVARQRIKKVAKRMIRKQVICLMAKWLASAPTPEPPVAKPLVS